jgi:hypothetical protein
MGKWLVARLVQSHPYVRLLFLVFVGNGCGGKTVVDPTCGAVCASMLACFDPGDPPNFTYSCADPCGDQEQSCARRGASSDFRGLLTCMSELTCSNAEQYFSSSLDPGGINLWSSTQRQSPIESETGYDVATACASQVTRVNLACGASP